MCLPIFPSPSYISQLTHCQGHDNFSRPPSRNASIPLCKNCPNDQAPSSTRQRARRFKALWTLYSTFTYLLVAIISTLVLGWQRWGPVEYSALSGGPVVYVPIPSTKYNAGGVSFSILATYGLLGYTFVRAAVDSFYQYRISKTQKYLDELHKQRESTIEKLKEATKYNSTQQLLEKYGGESPKPPPYSQQQSQEGAEDGRGSKRRGRDPATCAPLFPSPAGQDEQASPHHPRQIFRENTPAHYPTTPIRSPPPPQQPPALAPHPQTDEPGFAPNAFPIPPPGPSNELSSPSSLAGTAVS